jgi:crotonobetainyl-CoA:carnitine CoA-transferase CaiB-like acyl-CoA transferase
MSDDTGSPHWPFDDDAVGILEGTKVLDLSRILAGPYCAQMLADHGASVIKVEGPNGDDTRKWGTLIDDGSSSTYYYGLHRNKLNLELDLSTSEGQQVLGGLIDEADIVIENFKIGTMARWGFDYDTVIAPRRPDLIYCRISGFGADGPRGGEGGYDAVLQAYGGLMSVNGYADRGPLRVGVPIVDISAASLALNGILLAIIERGRSGLGQFIDVALLDAVVTLLVPHSQTWALSGKTPDRTGDAHPAVAPYQVFETAAGDFFIGAGNDRQFGSLMTVLGRPELAEDPRFATNPARSERIPELAGIIAELVANRDLDELASELDHVGVPTSPVKTLAGTFADPQVLHRELFIDDGDYRGVGIPLKFSRSRTRPPKPPAAKGADTARILQALDMEHLTAKKE